MFQAFKCCHRYFLMKLLDLFDTVAFVLRKKNSQITFLHVYHHNTMVFFGWIVMKFFPAGHISFLGYINNYVHMIMYTYYFVTSMWPEYKKNIWWKKYVTQIQMVQFCLAALHSFPMLFMEEVRYPRGVAVLVFVQNLVMLILFYDFYRKVYKKKKQV
ncbi:Elongation of very long chain fatty acids protein 7 [Blattella germanica]|nr:Elongation of very long chain fatty acids protein 7 [Blattella germanica]